MDSSRFTRQKSKNKKKSINLAKLTHSEKYELCF
jgi:hypothetical protein